MHQHLPAVVDAPWTAPGSVFCWLAWPGASLRVPILQVDIMTFELLISGDSRHSAPSALFFYFFYFVFYRVVPCLDASSEDRRSPVRRYLGTWVLGYIEQQYEPQMGWISGGSFSASGNQAINQLLEKRGRRGCRRTCTCTTCISQRNCVQWQSQRGPAGVHTTHSSTSSSALSLLFAVAGGLLWLRLPSAPGRDSAATLLEMNGSTSLIAQGFVLGPASHAPCGRSSKQEMDTGRKKQNKKKQGKYFGCCAMPELCQGEHGHSLLSCRKYQRYLSTVSASLCCGALQTTRSRKKPDESQRPAPDPTAIHAVQTPTTPHL